MKIITTTLMATAILLSSQAFAGGPPRWKETYYADQWGNTIHGSLHTLIKRIESGWDVKVVYRHNNLTKSFVCESVLVKGSLVACSNTSEISLTVDESSNYQFQSDAYHYYQIINSSGIAWASRWMVGEHRKRGDSKTQVAVKWFARR